MNGTVTGDSAEAVAYSLFRDCLTAAGKINASRPAEGMSEAEILALYGRCIATVRGSFHIAMPGTEIR